MSFDEVACWVIVAALWLFALTLIAVLVLDWRL
jgi:hypothetical protein